MKWLIWLTATGIIVAIPFVAHHAHSAISGNSKPNVSLILIVAAIGCISQIGLILSPLSINSSAAKKNIVMILMGPTVLVLINLIRDRFDPVDSNSLLLFLYLWMMIIYIAAYASLIREVTPATE